MERRVTDNRQEKLTSFWQASNNYTFTMFMTMNIFINTLYKLTFRKYVSDMYIFINNNNLSNLCHYACQLNWPDEDISCYKEIIIV